MGTPEAVQVRTIIAMALATAAALVPLSSAHALLGDRLEVFAAETFTYDSNVFRLSKDRDPQTAIGSSRRGDFNFTTSFGLNLDVPVSRQRFQANFAVNDVRFNRFTDLNNTGHEVRGQWLWQAGNDFSGAIGASQVEGLNTFVNLQQRLRDPVTTRQAFANGAWMVTPQWRLRGAVDTLELTHGEATQQVHNIDVTGVESSVSWISRAGNSLGVGVRQEEGRYPNRQVVAGTAFDNAYTQQSINALLDWQVTGNSRISGRAGWTERSYSQLSQRDYDGFLYRVVWDWRTAPGQRFGMSTIVQRDISAYEDFRTSFVLVQGVALRPTYQLTDKTSLGGIAEYASREYLGDPAFIVGGAGARRDRVYTGGLTLTWRPTRTISVFANALHERRTSNFLFGDYTANILSVRARIGF
jgi:exopolysaccharide biosynthesis operon protein EpsL